MWSILISVSFLFLHSLDSMMPPPIIFSFFGNQNAVHLTINTYGCWQFWIFFTRAFDKLKMSYNAYLIFLFHLICSLLWVHRWVLWDPYNIGTISPILFSYTFPVLLNFWYLSPLVQFSAESRMFGTSCILLSFGTAFPVRSLCPSQPALPPDGLCQLQRGRVLWKINQGPVFLRFLVVNHFGGRKHEGVQRAVRPLLSNCSTVDKFILL